MSESEIQKQTALALSENGFVSFRNNVGSAWTGSRVVSHPTVTRAKIVYDARPILFGLMKGSSDRIGWKEITVTPEMVGKTVAIFSAIECKTQMGRLSNEQINFLDRVSGAGGIAFVARSAADVGRELAKWITTIMKL